MQIDSSHIRGGLTRIQETALLPSRCYMTKLKAHAYLSTGLLATDMASYVLDRSRIAARARIPTDEWNTEETRVLLGVR